jgi:metal-sulfur cluster biosynthetic enzyme
MPPSKDRPARKARLTKEAIIEVLSSVLDPELGVDIYTLGFVRRIDLAARGSDLKLEMTLTSPLCPYGPRMIKEAESRLKALGLKKVAIELVFDPPWEPSPEARKIIGI